MSSRVGGFGEGCRPRVAAIEATKAEKADADGSVSVAETRRANWLSVKVYRVDLGDIAGANQENMNGAHDWALDRRE